MCMNRVRCVLAWLTVAGWVTFVPASFVTGPEHPARLLVNVYGVAVVGASMLWAQCWLLPNILQAYLMGLGDRHGAPEPGTPVRLHSVV